MIGRTLIISGGVVETGFAEEYLSREKFDTVVCADSGLDSAYQLGLPVHYAMGDFDSVSKEILASYQSEERQGIRTEFMPYPPEKDATDTHIVLDWVVKKHPEEIVILGATGKRLDHFLANVHILMQPLLQGIPTYLVDKYNKLYMIDHEYLLKKEELPGKYISLIPFTQRVTGVCLKGFKYGLENAVLTAGDSLGISNELMEGEESASIILKEGILIVVESREM